MQVCSILDTIIHTVAHWYQGNSGPFCYELRVGQCHRIFSSQTAMSPKQKALLDYSESRLEDWVFKLQNEPDFKIMKMVREELAVCWLRLHNPDVAWGKCLGYAESLRHRTYENRSMQLNLIVSKGDGYYDITDDFLQKIFDPLARDSRVYLRVNQQLRFISYDEVKNAQGISDNRRPVAPDSLQHFLELLDQYEDCFVHLSSCGDVVVAQSSGIIAVFRKGLWYLYEESCLRDSIEVLVGQKRLAENLLDILLELSYRRHGALLIFDPNFHVMKHVVNQNLCSPMDSSLNHGLPYSILAPILESVDLSSEHPYENKKHLLLELAEIDGALIFDHSKIRGFGALIEPHVSYGFCYGSRTLAAHSSVHWGGVAFMVSCDGEINVVFKNGTGHELAELRFM